MILGTKQHGQRDHEAAEYSSKKDDVPFLLYHVLGDKFDGVAFERLLAYNTCHIGEDACGENSADEITYP